MIIKLGGAYKVFSGVLYRIRFENGMSIDNVDEYVFNLLNGVIGAEPAVVHEGCHLCKKFAEESQSIKKAYDELMVEYTKLMDKKKK